MRTKLRSVNAAGGSVTIPLTFQASPDVFAIHLTPTGPTGSNASCLIAGIPAESRTPDVTVTIGACATATCAGGTSGFPGDRSGIAGQRPGQWPGKGAPGAKQDFFAR
jgi:hypothetical protein